MNWKKYLLYPLAIYAVIFLFISALIGFKVDQHANWVWVVTLIITIVGLYLATKHAKPQSIKEGLMLGIVWAIVFVVLDLILTRPFTGWSYFSSWQTWLVYALAIIMPTILPKSNPTAESAEVK